MDHIKNITDEVFEKICRKTILETLDELPIFILDNSVFNTTVKFKEVDSGKLKETVSLLPISSAYSNVLKQLFTIDSDNHYIDITEFLIEKLQKRIFFAVKDLNKDFDDIPIDIYIKEMAELEEKNDGRIIRKIMGNK